MKRKNHGKKLFNLKVDLPRGDIKGFGTELKKLITLKQKVSMQLFA